MKSKSLYVDEDVFKSLSPLVGSYDFDFIRSFVGIAQDIDISERIGESLSVRLQEGIANNNLNSLEIELLNEYVQPATVHFTMFRAMNFLSVKPDNSGLVRRNSENGQSLDMNESNFLAEQEKTIAESYGKRLKDYLDANRTSYPQYAQEMAGQISPSSTPSFTGGMWLGKNTCKDTVASDPTPPPALASISNLRYAGQSAVNEIGTSVDSPVFDWDETGMPLGLTISDNKGNTFTVDAKPFTMPTTYTGDAADKVTWTLSGSNVTATATSTAWIHASYWGVSDDNTIDSTDILGSNSMLVATSPSFSPAMNVAGDKFGFIAVEKGMTGKVYTSWYVDILNNGGIGQFEFIDYQGIVTLGTVDYDVYVWNYTSELNATIKFE